MRKSLRVTTIATAAIATFATAGAAVAVTPSATTSATASPTISPTVSAAPSSGASRLAAIQAAGAKATSDRITALDTAIPKVTANAALSGADKATILDTLNTDLAAMHPLAAKIAADATVAQASADYKSIFADYRVFAVALPQSAYAAAADDLTDTTLPKLTAAQKSLAALLAGPDAAKSTPALQAQLADLANKIAAAQTTITGVAAAALGVTPTAYDANHAILAPIRQSESTALADAKAAGVDASDIVAALK